MRMTDQDPMFEPFEALIGTWATEATHPLVDVVVPGSVTLEWLEGGRFLIHQRGRLGVTAARGDGSREAEAGDRRLRAAAPPGHEKWSEMIR